VRWQHFDELEADFQQYYSLDVALVKPARAARLMYQLPKKCRLFTIINPAVQWGWREVLANRTNYLLDTIIWQNSNEGVKKHKQTAKPEQWLPEFMKGVQNTPESEKHTVDDIKAILARPRR
jgi:hypothetical protein